MSITRSNILEADHCIEVIYNQLHDLARLCNLECQFNAEINKINQPMRLSKRESLSVFIDWIIRVLQSEKNSTTTSNISLSEVGKGLATGELHNKNNLPPTIAEAQHKKSQIDCIVEKLNDIKKEANTFSAWTTLQECLNKLIILFKSFSQSKTKEKIPQPKTELLKNLNDCGLFSKAEGSTQQSTEQLCQAPVLPPRQYK